MNGWRLVGTLSLLLAAMALYLMASHGWDIEGVRLAIRATARTSWFCLRSPSPPAPWSSCCRSGATRWQRRNRRYLGVSFAVSHFIHLGVILALAALDRELFWKLTNVMTIVLAGAAYLFIAAMTATSFDRTAAWLGPRKWRLLHLIGGWYIWISFAVAVGKRVPLDAFYWPMAVLVLAIAVVR